VQPILTLVTTERPLSTSRIAGLLLALGGLTLVVMNGIASARFALLGTGFALLALAAMTYGTLEQKKIDQPPASVLPLQYAVSIATCMLLMPLETVRIEFNASLLGSLFAMGVVISVAATLVFYRLIRAGNLVNVTSLFYLVPAGTAALDWLVFGNVMAPAALAGMAAIVAGLLIVFRRR